jgi:hypothetical protein
MGRPDKIGWETNGFNNGNRSRIYQPGKTKSV